MYKKYQFLLASLFHITNLCASDSSSEENERKFHTQSIVSKDEFGKRCIQVNVSENEYKEIQTAAQNLKDISEDENYKYVWVQPTLELRIEKFGLKRVVGKDEIIPSYRPSLYSAGSKIIGSDDDFINHMNNLNVSDAAGKEKDSVSILDSPTLLPTNHTNNNVNSEALITPKKEIQLDRPNTDPLPKINYSNHDKDLEQPITPLNSKTKPRKSVTDPIPKRRSNDEIYQNRITVSQKFLSPEKNEFLNSVVIAKLENFKKSYISQKASSIDITGLSSRSRIFLLQSIINHKIGFLPNYQCSKFSEFQKLKLRNTFWEKKPNVKFAEIKDLIPTDLKIGNFTYKLELGVTFHQPGSGRIYGLTSARYGDKYEKVFQILESYTCDEREEIGALFLKQKKTGECIDKYSQEKNRFLNGLNLLLDYEVARRLTEKDKYKNLPVITYVNHIINNLKNLDLIKPLFLPKKENEEMALFQGGQREAFAKNISITNNSKTQMRSDLRSLHQSDEESDDQYSSSDENIKVEGIEDLKT